MSHERKGAPSKQRNSEEHRVPDEIVMQERGRAPKRSRHDSREKSTSYSPASLRNSRSPSSREEGIDSPSAQPPKKRMKRARKKEDNSEFPEYHPSTKITPPAHNFSSSSSSSSNTKYAQKSPRSHGRDDSENIHDDVIVTHRDKINALAYPTAGTRCSFTLSAFEKYPYIADEERRMIAALLFHIKPILGCDKINYGSRERDKCSVTTFEVEDTGPAWLVRILIAASPSLSFTVDENFTRNVKQLEPYEVRSVRTKHVTDVKGAPQYIVEVFITKCNAASTLGKIEERKAPLRPVSITSADPNAILQDLSMQMLQYNRSMDKMRNSDRYSHVDTHGSVLVSADPEVRQNYHTSFDGYRNVRGGVEDIRGWKPYSDTERLSSHEPSAPPWNEHARHVTSELQHSLHHRETPVSSLYESRNAQAYRNERSTKSVHYPPQPPSLPPHYPPLPVPRSSLRLPAIIPGSSFVANPEPVDRGNTGYEAYPKQSPRSRMDVARQERESSSHDMERKSETPRRGRNRQRNARNRDSLSYSSREEEEEEDSREDEATVKETPPETPSSGRKSARNHSASPRSKSEKRRSSSRENNARDKNRRRDKSKSEEEQKTPSKSGVREIFYNMGSFIGSVV